jgi:hypothetical protein
VFEVEQQPLREGPAHQRDRMCATCAYRPGSPERTDDPQAGANEDDLRDLIHNGGTFHCHEGLRRPIGYRHPPSGQVVAASPLDWQPPVVKGRAFQVDGQPAQLCAGLCAARRMGDLL